MPILKQVRIDRGQPPLAEVHYMIEAWESRRRIKSSEREDTPRGGC